MKKWNKAALLSAFTAYEHKFVIEDSTENQDRIINFFNKIIMRMTRAVLRLVWPYDAIQRHVGI